MPQNKMQDSHLKTPTLALPMELSALQVQKSVSACWSYTRPSTEPTLASRVMWSFPSKPTELMVPFCRVGIILALPRFYPTVFCNVLKKYGVEFILGSKVLCALFRNLHTLPFLPLSPLEGKFQSKTRMEPLTQ